MDHNFEAAIHERRAYQRAWRAKNRDRVRKYNTDYWERRATRKRQEVNGNAANENDQRGRETRPGD